MLVYLAAPIRGDRSAIRAVRTMAAAVVRRGHRLLTWHVAEPDARGLEAGLSERAIFERDRAWLAESELVLAEVSAPSIGVGMEVAWALDRGKEVHCFHRRGAAVSALVLGNDAPNLSVHTYGSDTELGLELERALGGAHASRARASPRRSPAGP